MTCTLQEDLNIYVQVIYFVRIVCEGTNFSNKPELTTLCLFKSEKSSNIFLCGKLLTNTFTCYLQTGVQYYDSDNFLVPY